MYYGGTHHSMPSMKKLLERVGVSHKVLDVLPEVVQTCQVCREWQKSGPDNVCSIDLVDTINQRVECDLVFIDSHVIFHMLDRCVRWHATKVITNEEADTLIEALDDIWFSIHGPPKELIMDNEHGLMGSKKAQGYLARRGVKPHGRGKDHHARFIERRGALFRDVVHNIQSQIKEEGLTGKMTFKQIVSEATFCGNAMLSVNDSTPYIGLYGRVPNIIPGIDQIIEPGGSGRADTDTLRHVHRLG